jgi:putative transposase
MILAFRYALDPADVQRDRLASHVGAVRFAYNWALDHVKTNWDTRKAQEKAGVPEEERVPWVDFSARGLRDALNAVKDEIAPWWKENSKEAFATGTANCAVALKNWDDSRKGKRKGRKVGFPKPKKKLRDGGAGVKFTTGTMRLEADGRHVTLPRLGTVRLHERAGQLGKFLAQGARIRGATVKFQGTRWFVSLLVDVPDELALAHFGRKVGNRKRKKSLGADQGLKTRLFLSDGGEVENPRNLVNALRKLRRLNKRLSRRRGYDKTTGEAASNRYERTRAQISRQHAKVANRRKDFLDKLTTWLVLNYAFIGVETLNVSGMIRNKHLARHIADAGFYEFVRMLKYKAERYGCTVVLVDRWFPSSKKCSNCDKTKATLSLSERIYKCGSCGAVFDRDHNAALNIEAEAWRMFAEAQLQEIEAREAEDAASINAVASCVEALNGRGEGSSGPEAVGHRLKLRSEKRQESEACGRRSQRGVCEGTTHNGLVESCAGAEPACNQRQLICER